MTDVASEQRKDWRPRVLPLDQTYTGQALKVLEHIPATNVQPEQLEQTRKFASALANRLLGESAARPRHETPQPRWP